MKVLFLQLSRSFVLSEQRLGQKGCIEVNSPGSGGDRRREKPGLFVHTSAIDFLFTNYRKLVRDMLS